MTSNRNFPGYKISLLPKFLKFPREYQKVVFEHREHEIASRRRKGRGNLYSEGKLIRKVTGEHCLLETKQKKSKFPSGKIGKDRQYLLTGFRKQENQTHNGLIFLPTHAAQDPETGAGPHDEDGSAF